MSAQIIQFSTLAEAAAEKRLSQGDQKGALNRFRTARRAKREERLAIPRDQLTETAFNKHERDRLKDAWSAAEAARQYWRAKLDLEDAISRVRSHGLPEGRGEKEYSPTDRDAYLEAWRAALIVQMKTQAPDMLAIAWKKGQLSNYTFRNADVQKQCQQIIAADEKWLKDHPTRRDAFTGKKGKGGKRT